MSPFSYRTFGGEHGIAYPPTGWVAGQFIKRGRPAWAVEHEDGVVLTGWDGTDRLISASVKVLRLPEPPVHHMLVEHLLMAGWRGVHRASSKKKHVDEEVVAFAPDAAGQTLFEVPNQQRSDDRITVLRGGVEVGKFDRTADAITAWLRKEEA